jgi:hypothetical protein
MSEPAGMVEVTIFLDAERMPQNLLDKIESLICPHPEEPGHQDLCPIIAMGSQPF